MHQPGPHATHATATEQINGFKTLDAGALSTPGTLLCSVCPHQDSDGPGCSRSFHLFSPRTTTREPVSVTAVDGVTEKKGVRTLHTCHNTSLEEDIMMVH